MERSVNKRVAAPAEGISQEELRLILPRYGVSDPGPEFPAPASYSKMPLTLISIEDIPVVVKRYRMLDRQRASLLDAPLTSFSRAAITPSVWPNEAGQAITEIDGSFYSLISYFPTASSRQGILIAELAEATARMHELFRNYSQQPLNSPHFVEPDYLHWLLRHHNLGRYLNFLSMSSEHVPGCRIQYVHNDLHQDNFLLTSSGQIYLVDFESFSTNPLIVDVMFAAFRLQEDFSEESLQFLRCYDRLNPFNDCEKEAAFLLHLHDLIKKLGFILAESEKGNDRYLKNDFAKYQRFITSGIDALARFPDGLTQALH